MMRLHTATLPLLGLALLAAPAAAQDHSAHQGQAAPTPTPAPTPTAADPHAGHAMPVADPPSVQPDAMEGMDHSMMDHSADVSQSPGPEMETPPPPDAGSGPPRAADAIWSAEAMRASREDLRHHGDFPLFWFQADRAEFQARDGADSYLWDAQGYYGGPTSRF